MTGIRAFGATLLILSLTGCGGFGGNYPSVAPSTSATLTGAPTQSLESPPADSPADDQTQTTGPRQLDAGERLITGTKTGLSLAVPKSWTKIDAGELKSPAILRELAKFADQLGIPLEQLRQLLAQQIDLMAVSATTSPATYAAVEVLRFPAIAEIPSREALQAQYDALKVDALGFRNVVTPVGRGVVSEVRKMVPGGKVAVTEALFVQLRSGVTGVSVTASTRQRARAVIDSMIGTLKDVGSGQIDGAGATLAG